jgi:hypothetical protein
VGLPAVFHLKHSLRFVFRNHPVDDDAVVESGVAAKWRSAVKTPYRIGVARAREREAGQSRKSSRFGARRPHAKNRRALFRSELRDGLDRQHGDGLMVAVNVGLGQERQDQVIILALQQSQQLLPDACDVPDPQTLLRIQRKARVLLLEKIIAPNAQDPARPQHFFTADFAEMFSPRGLVRQRQPVVGLRRSRILAAGLAVGDDDLIDGAAQFMSDPVHQTRTFGFIVGVRDDKQRFEDRRFPGCDQVECRRFVPECGAAGERTQDPLAAETAFP